MAFCLGEVSNYQFIEYSSEHRRISLSRLYSSYHQHIAVAFGKINVISRISYEQCDKNAERPPVPFAERVEHIQLVVELSQLGEEGFPVHAAEVILLF